MKNLEDKGLEFSYELVVTSYENWTRDRSADGQKTECTLVAAQIPERTKFLIFNSSALIFN